MSYKLYIQEPPGIVSYLFIAQVLILLFVGHSYYDNVNWYKKTSAEHKLEFINHVQGR